jgi:hypothetical protein
MSDPVAKAERSRAKDKRQGVIEQRGALPKSKKKIDKPYSVWTYWVLAKKEEPWERYKCATLEQAKYLLERETRVRRQDKAWWITYNGERIDG